MFDFLSRWRPSLTHADREETLPWPATEKSKRNSPAEFNLDSISISAPIPRSSPSSLKGFDEQAGNGNPMPASSRADLSNIAWLRSSGSLGQQQTRIPTQDVSTPPTVVRMDSISHVHPIGRSVSSPPASTSFISPVSETATSSLPRGGLSTRSGLRLHTSASFTQGSRSLRLDAQPSPASADVYGHAYNYPLAKQLSPIAEQDYFSPVSLQHSTSLPIGSKNGSVSGSISYSNSLVSEVTRPSPVYSSPFITRQLNRTVSQASSRTHLSTTSSVPRPSVSIKSADAPSIPPLDLRPPFPGPHPSHGGNGPALRPRRSTITAMPTISGSVEEFIGSEYDGDDDDRGSLHAESFVTATSEANSARPLSPRQKGQAIDVDSQIIPENGSLVPSVHSGHSRNPSASESFITRRWERDAALGFDAPTFRAKRQWLTVTPAFWAFWLGFVCPFLWMVGGWHFTNFGEQPPRLSFWEFYFNAGFWKEKLCGGRDKKKDLREGTLCPPLPKWVAEKQMSDDGRARLNDPKRSLRGISFGYPFIPRPVRADTYKQPWYIRVVVALDRLNRIFDHLYGVKLREVRGRPESGRRIFDPWIQRCRYALCYAIVLLSIGLCTASVYLIICNTRRLR